MYVRRTRGASRCKDSHWRRSDPCKDLQVLVAPGGSSKHRLGVRWGEASESGCIVIIIMYSTARYVADIFHVSHRHAAPFSPAFSTCLMRSSMVTAFRP
jgi:hypothetical protein